MFACCSAPRVVCCHGRRPAAGTPPPAPASPVPQSQPRPPIAPSRKQELSPASPPSAAPSRVTKKQNDDEVARTAEQWLRGSRERFMFDFLTAQLGLAVSVAEGYVPGLIEQGYDMEDTFLGLSAEELRDDFEWKKGHIRKFDMYLAQQSPSPPQ
eukprot:COSAG06_NODE_9802_length_1813_cov_1.543174_1_plen_154_part_10